MQAYRARYERGRVVPFGEPEIPEGSDLIITVIGTATPDGDLSRQQLAVNEFLEGIHNCGESLGSEFDVAIGQRFNIVRELDL